jgi:fatty acid/phospholipid biosynthesis enzyme
MFVVGVVALIASEGCAAGFYGGVIDRHVFDVVVDVIVTDGAREV